MSDNYIKQAKAELDQLDGTNMRVNLEFQNGELFMITLEKLPLNLNVTYKIRTDSMSYPLKMELLVTD